MTVRYGPAQGVKAKLALIDWAVIAIEFGIGAGGLWLYHERGHGVWLFAGVVGFSCGAFLLGTWNGLLSSRKSAEAIQ